MEWLGRGWGSFSSKQVASLPAHTFQELTSQDLVAVFGGTDPIAPPLDDPDLKPERVQGW